MSDTDSIFARALAETDAGKQAAFLNVFYHYLKVGCKGRHETQVSYIADALDTNGREFAESLAIFAKFAMETRAKVETELQQLTRSVTKLKKR
jgi:hypothetical protein